MLEMRRALAWSLLLTAACGRDVSFVEPQAAVEQEDSTETGGGDPTVVRGNLTMVVRVASPDASLAEAIGGNADGLADVVVTLRRIGHASRTDTTGPGGIVEATGLLAGAWTVSAIRALTGSERALLPPQSTDITGFAGATTVTVGPGDATVLIEVLAGRQGGLIISELFATAPTGFNGVPYGAGHFVELYNNGFETIYLDGMVYGAVSPLASRETSAVTCSGWEVFTRDSTAIWAQYFERLPGSGTDYPLAPGATAVIATDAIDHREFARDLLDLTTATFESLGSADVDNPAVPNTQSIGTLEYGAALGHGHRWSSLEPKPFVALPFDPDTMATVLDGFGLRHVRIPRALVLDVLTLRLRDELDFGADRRCDAVIHRVFDAQYYDEFDVYSSMSIRRRTLQVFDDGRVILQRTKNSAVDLEVGPPTPGRVH